MTDMTLLRPTGRPAVTATVSTPIGPFTVIVEPGPASTTDNGGGDPAGGDAVADGAALPVVLASGWTADLDDLLPLIAPGLRPTTVHPVAPDDPALAAVTDAVIAYHGGNLESIDRIPVRQTGGAYLDHAWQVLRQVEPGEPLSYTGFAVRTGRPTAIRAAASACARNAAALFVPCHRILRSDGSLGGFRWGLPAKAWLLDHESARSASAQPALSASS